MPKPKGTAQDDAFIQSFLDWLKTDGRSDKTITAYRADLKLVSSALKDLSEEGGLLSASSADLMTALGQPVIQSRSNGQPRSPDSIKRIHSALKAFFTWTSAAELRSDNPAKSFRLRGGRRKLPVFLSLREKKRLLKTLRGRTSSVSFRDRVMIEVLLHTGIRLSELVNLDLDDVDLDDKRLCIRAKGGNEQFKFIKTSLRSLLKTYLTRYRLQVPDEPALFVSNWRRRISGRQVEARVAHWVKESGIDKPISPHKLRHTFATHLLRIEGNLKLVQRALGHASITSTTVYTHVSDEEVREALEHL